MINFSKVVYFIERCLPTSFVEQYRNLKWITKKLFYHIRYNSILVKLRKKKSPINVYFFLLDSSMWKYDALYKIMQADEMFNVSILICMRADLSLTLAVENIKKCELLCKQKGYNYVLSYSDRKLINPQRLNADIIFYCNPYERFYKKGFYMNDLHKCLICYANYSYEIIPFKWAFAGTMQNLAWRYFCESKEHQKLIKYHSILKGWNTVVSGYPMLDVFNNYKANKLCWKIKDNTHKRIIWAPHQSIFDCEMSDKHTAVQFSTFLLYADYMIELADKYKNAIQIAFKPHPFLKRNLYNHPKWGKVKTDLYYEKWENMENTICVEGDYVDLFCTSDALIHDCGSFTAEYLCLNKPVMYLATYMNDSSMNKIGKLAYGCHYIGNNKNDILNFIVDVMLNNNDTLRFKRLDFYHKFLLPPNHQSSSENIMFEIKRALQNLV